MGRMAAAQAAEVGQHLVCRNTRVEHSVEGLGVEEKEELIQSGLKLPGT